MTTIKSYTDLEQSKKLTEILPIESADMKYISFRHRDETIEWTPQLGTPSKYDIPCWSLAALFGVLTENKICHYGNRYYCQYISEGDEFPIYSTAEYDNPVDACYEMIIKLSKLKML